MLRSICASFTLQKDMFFPKLTIIFLLTLKKLNKKNTT
jgi:hypothetical protein